MNNQAAQTMPEPVTASMCQSSDYAKGWNDCLAALSQTAVVAEVGLEAFTEYFVKNYPGPDTIIYDPKWHAPRIFRAAQRAIQSAAPAASSGECKTDADLPGMWERADLIGGMTDAEPQPPAAASVSERARVTQAMLDAGTSAMIEFRKSGGDWTDKPAHAAEVVIRADLEQALAQQRVCATCGGSGEIGGHVGQTAETFDYVTEPCPECTTPKPSADAVRELVKRWLTDAPDDAHSTSMWDQGYAHGRNECADELESMLSGDSHA